MKRVLVMMLVAATFMSTPFVNVATENVQAATVSQVSIQGKENLIKNGDFNNGTTDWGYFTAEGGKGSISNENGALKATVKKLGDVAYGLQVYNQSFPLYKGGKYVLKFDISSSVKRDVEAMIQLDGGDYHSYTWKKVTASPSKQSIVMEFTMKDDTDLVPKLCFNCGLEKGYENLGEHSISIDNVGLYLVDDSAVDYSKEEKEEQPIVLNQLGYLPNGVKKVVFRGDVKDKTFKVVSKDSGKTVYTGSISGPKFNGTANETDYYGDFSELTTPGTYVVKTDKLGSSYEFKIGDDVYKDVFKKAQKFFYYQRCGESLPESLAGKWAHPECHKSLAKIYNTNEYIDVSGGWHDAGDYGRYVVATSKSVADLIMAYNANKEAFTDDIGIPESGNGQADILDEVKGQFKWLFKMQNKNNGGVYHKVTCADFPGTIMPQDEKSQLIVCPITTTATADFAAVMAMGYETFKDSDKTFANQCLAAAEKAYSYLETAPSQIVKNPEGIVTGEYGDTNDRDERYWAAAELFKATGKSKYNNKVKEFVNQKVEVGYDWPLVGNYGNEAYLSAAGADANVIAKIKEAVIKEADKAVSASKNDGYAVSNGSKFIWGSNMAVLNDSILLDFVSTFAPKADYAEIAQEHINYCFGKNANAMSFVTGYGTVYPEHPHHRPSQKMGSAIPGMIIGGVNSGLEDPYAKVYLKDAAPAKCYLDNEQCYSINEVDIYWNSTLVNALSKTGMVGAATTTQPTEQEKPQEQEKPVTPEQPQEQQKPDTPQQPETPEQPEVPFGDSKFDVKVSTTAGNEVRQTYTITAKESNADLSKTAIKYYFKKNDSKSINAVCHNTGVYLNQAPWYQCLTSNTKVSIGKDSKGTYLEIKFNKSFVLPNDGSRMTVELGFNNSDWSAMSGFKEIGTEVISLK